VKRKAKAETEPPALRKRAEAKVRGSVSRGSTTLSAEEAERLLHELEVHQVELELQNEELRFTRDELELNYARYMELYDFAPVGYVSLSPEGTLLKSNLAAARLLGLNRSVVVGKPLSQFLVPWHREGWVGLLDRIRQYRSQVETLEVQLNGDERGRRTIALTLRPLGPSRKGSEPTRILAVMVDNTEVRENERKLQRVHEELQAAVMARDNLLAVVAHDLQTPLSAIRLSSQLQERHAHDEVTQRHSRLILREVEKMQRLLKDLLQAASIETGHFSVELGPHSLLPVLAQILEMFEPIAAERHITLEGLLPDDLPAVMCDPPRIGQVLSNLVSNALKFVPDKGRVVVQVEALESSARISVVDSGPGIPKDVQSRLFDRYWKGKQQGRHGFGLGLYISKGIVEAHGGAMQVESTPGKGATFRFTLPLAEEHTFNVLRP
jgi:PAS domain S-box-containing protein